MRRKRDWRPGLPAILVPAGGFGAGNAARMIEALMAAKIPAQIIAVCGKSAALKAAAIEKSRAGERRTTCLM